MERQVTIKGIGASSGIATGKVRVIMSPLDVPKLREGEVMVSPYTSPIFSPAILNACAVVTDLGGILSHAAIVAREMGIPCVVGTEQATTVLKDGMEVTVDGAQGLIYAVN